MEVQIGEFNRSIKSLNVSSRIQGDDTMYIQLVIECTDTDDDVEYLINLINEELKENNIRILNGDTYSDFSNYKLSSIDKYVSETSSRLSITFVK